VDEGEKSVFRVVIKGSVQDVWREITRTDELQKCFFNMRLDTDGLKPGGQIRMRSASGKTTPVVGEIVEFDPPHRYVHTFKFTQYDDPPCTVVHELKEVDGGVEYTLTNMNMKPGTKSTGQMNQGGPMICSTLKSVVETGKPSFGVRILHVLFKLLEPLSPKKCRSENWSVNQKI
jgi:uncharacterized protein YndB with AHSA1/START domain